MIEYLYTAKYPAEEPSTFHFKDEQPSQPSHQLYRCTHPQEAEHSCMNDTCYLSLYHFHVLIYNLGDKYDIPALRKYCCSRLKALFEQIRPATCEHRLMIYDVLYQHSRVKDELRGMLIDKIYESICGAWSDYRVTWEDGPKLLSFLDRSPELFGPILKRNLESIWAEEKSFFEWEAARPSLRPPPWASWGSPP